MIRKFRALLLALAVLAAPAELAFAMDAPAASAADPHQVLVLMRMPPGHARPGVSAGGGYGDEAGQAVRRRLAQKLAAAHGLELVDGWPMPLLGVDCYIMNVPDGRSTVEVARLLARESAVQDAQPSQMFHAQGAPRSADPLRAAQPAAGEWRLAALHELAVGRGVRVAVVDSMVDPTHPDLAGQVELTRNFVAGRPAAPETHGTGVAGVIAARGDNGIGIVGVAPGARILGLRACWQGAPRKGAGDTVCDSLSLAQALHFAIDAKARVINLSLSGPPDPLLARLIDVAISRGIKVVAAYDRGLPDGGFPANHTGVVAVADEALASPRPGVYSAPGRDVPTTQPGGRWFLVDGSSYAAAHVSGLLALVDERRPQPRARLLSRARGEIDACASLLRVASRANCACASPDNGR
ncbi:MAG: S8 family serine peptidase [Phenylobacterium sp.]|uniref:S8 family peptidase n=1 Tax=Phenylobacterium sp. TaxID=1871053 RepID=UPI001A49E830|nr:S8 family serine peptidase [Phenylobacterium sp.]MBL8771697.1 S8 family serine peptidase [Phenylobacterium sp.]